MKTQKKAKANPESIENLKKNLRKPRTICQIKKDLDALNDFFDQQLISVEAFERRKQAILDELEGK
jgi:hypothetical protein